MDPQAVAELRTLRARAYGPDADIFGDAAALERLDELEARALTRPAPPAAPTAEETTAPEHPAPVVDDGRIEQIPDAAASDLVHDAVFEDAPPARPRRTRRRLILTWIGSLLVAVVITSFVTSFVTRRSGYDAPVEGVLVEDPSFDWEAMSGENTSAYAEFYDLRVISFSGDRIGRGQSGSAVETCLQIFDSTGIDPLTSTYSGDSSFFGCGTQDFPPRAIVTVSDRSPQALRDRYAVGTSLAFVLEGAEITVLGGPVPEVEATQRANPL